MRKYRIKETGIIITDQEYRELFPNISFPLDYIPDGVEIISPEDNSVPQFISMRQARIALLKLNILNTVSQMIADIPDHDGDIARIEWEFSQEIGRESDFILRIKDNMKLSDEFLDELFLSASKI